MFVNLNPLIKILFLHPLLNITKVFKSILFPLRVFPHIHHFSWDEKWWWTITERVVEHCVVKDKLYDSIYRLYRHLNIIWYVQTTKITMNNCRVWYFFSFEVFVIHTKRVLLRTNRKSISDKKENLRVTLLKLI